MVIKKQNFIKHLQLNGIFSFKVVACKLRMLVAEGISITPFELSLRPTNDKIYPKWIEKALHIVHWFHKVVFGG